MTVFEIFLKIHYVVHDLQGGTPLIEKLKVRINLIRFTALLQEKSKGQIRMHCLVAAVFWMLFRVRALAEPFLRQALADLPDLRPELLAAAEYYAKVRRLRAEMDDLIADNFAPEVMQAPKDPARRRAFADLILRIRDVEEKAIKVFERLIARCSEPV